MSFRVNNLRVNKALSCVGVLVLAASGGIATTFASAASASAGGTTVDGHKCTIVGTAGNDVLHGTSHHDVICGLGGNDRIMGNGGDDLILGGPGNDRIQGGPGNDTENGGAGNDHLDGGRGRDHLNGGPGKDTLSGDDGNDALNGGSGDDIEMGGPGNDDINEGSGNGTIDGGSGSDNINCGTGSPSINSDGHDHESHDCQGDRHDLQSYKGSVTAVDGAAHTITVQWIGANPNAHTWLDAHGDPNPIVVGLTNTTHVSVEGHGNTITTGDGVEVEATTTPDMSTLVAVAVKAEHEAGDDH